MNRDKLMYLSLNLSQIYIQSFIRYLMGIQASKALDRKPSRTKSNLSQKVVSSDEIAEFASQLNHLVSINLQNQQDKYDYLVFKKIPFTGKFAPLPLCSNISHQYDSVFVCYDCSTDPHAYICEACFEKANHEGHRFSVFPNNAGWTQLYCRCGDYEFMNKNTICEKHKEVKVMPKVTIDDKEKKKFSLYFHEIFKTVFSLLKKYRGAQSLLNALFMYLQKATQNNLGYSKIFCEFLLEKNVVDAETSNLGKLIRMTCITDTNFFRNLNFATEYKLDILREVILAVNQNTVNVSYLSEMIINFASKMEHLDHLAKNQNLILGSNSQEEIKTKKFKPFYDKIISENFDANEIWKCIIRNKLVKSFIGHDNVIRKILQFLYEEKNSSTEIAIFFLEQLVECEVNQSNNYIIPCLMILSPECFIIDSPTKERSFDKKIESLFVKYYQRVFAWITTNNSSQELFEKNFLLLPFFSFGESAIKSFWQELDRRISVFEKTKEKAMIKQASMNVFGFLTKILESFFKWEHLVVQEASSNKLKSFSQDKKLIDRLLKESFFKSKKIFRLDMLSVVDLYTQKERNLGSESIKKYLRYNARKGKYYFVGEILGNNFYDYQELKVGAPAKLSEWQQFVYKKVFNEHLYKIVPKLIKIAQKGLMQDIFMVKTVSNISIALTILNKSEKKTLKDVTRNFIKEIPDVNEDVYYILAAIRDRMELDIDDLEEEGLRGKKKQKLDLIAEIRDKKYKAMKEKQNNILNEWLKKTDKEDLDQAEKNYDQNICHICKEKQTKTNRFVFLANFTRNNVVSTLLKSQVTDLDINICLHKIHEQCYDKVTQKRKCPLCKFDINCYIPEKPLADESYTKNWLRNFENIITTINLEAGKSFNSDWATIFLTYLVFNRGFKVLLKSTEVQTKQRQKIDALLMLHYKNQLQKWPELSKQAIKRAEKTVKGQVSRQSNIKKAVKSLMLDLTLQQITQEPFKNQKRIEKKIRELINLIGLKNTERVCNQFEFCRNSNSIKEILEQSISEEDEDKQLFKIRDFPKDAKEYLKETSIKCPMCGKYQPSTWQCLFCEKVSCDNCISVRNHCERDHRGSSIFLYLNNAEYKLMHDNREVEKDSLYRNEYSEGWTRNQKPEGWKCCTEEIYSFFDKILHSLSINKDKNNDDDSDDGRPNRNNMFGGFGQNFGLGQNLGFSQNVGFGHTFGRFNARPAVRSWERNQQEDQEEQLEEEEDQ